MVEIYWLMDLTTTQPICERVAFYFSGQKHNLNILEVQFSVKSVPNEVCGNITELVESF